MGIGLGLGLGIPFRRGGTSWSSYCTPQSLTATIISDTQIDLSWTSACTSEDGFVIERSTDGVNFIEIDAVAPDATTFSDTSCVSGNTYYYRVRAFKGGSYGDYSDLIHSTTFISQIWNSNTVFWFDSTDLTTITKDGSDNISRWNCKYGTGHDLLQADGSKQPAWSSNGVVFDGSDNFMKCNAFTFNKPELIYLVFKPVSWVVSRFIFGGNTALTGDYYQISLAPNYALHAGTAGFLTTVSTGDWHINRLLFNGASSYQIIDGGAKVTGNSGTNNMGGFLLGGIGGTGGSCANFIVKEVIGRKIDDSAGDQTVIYNYLATKYSLPTI